MQSVNLFRPLLVLMGALGLTACAGDGRNEPLYALVDRTQRIVAVAGQSQLRGAPPGSEVQAVVGGQEQTLMVAERVGTGPILRAAPSRAETWADGPAPMMPVTGTELAPVTTADLSPPARGQQARRAGSRRGAASEPVMASGASQPSPTTTAALPSSEPTRPTRRASSRRTAASEPGANTRTGRRAGPTSRAVSRSVM